VTAALAWVWFYLRRWRHLCDALSLCCRPQWHYLCRLPVESLDQNGAASLIVMDVLGVTLLHKDSAICLSSGTQLLPVPSRCA